jgi:hypothetical protein
VRSSTRGRGMAEGEAWCAVAAGSPRRSLQHKVDAPQLCDLLAGRRAGREMEALDEHLLRGLCGVCDADHGQEGSPRVLPLAQPMVMAELPALRLPLPALGPFHRSTSSPFLVSTDPLLHPFLENPAISPLLGGSPPPKLTDTPE